MITTPTPPIHHASRGFFLKKFPKNMLVFLLFLRLREGADDFFDVVFFVVKSILLQEDCCK